MCKGQRSVEDQGGATTYNGWAGLSIRVKSLSRHPSSFLLSATWCQHTMLVMKRLSKSEEKTIKIRAYKLAACEPNYAGRWFVFSRHHITKQNKQKTTFSRHLIICGLA